MLRQLCFNYIKKHGVKITCPAKHQANSCWDLKIVSRRNLTTNGDAKTIDFKIRKDDSQSIDKTLRRHRNVQLDDLEVNLKGEIMIFNLTWLRDSCHCNECTHPYSRQRLYTAKDFDLCHFDISDVKLMSAHDALSLKNHIIQGDAELGLLKIEWMNGHKSVYSLDWLRSINRRYKRTQLRLSGEQKTYFEFPRDDFYSPRGEHVTPPKFWNVDKITAGLDPVDYNDLIDGFKFNDDSTFINANLISDMSNRRYESFRKLIANLVEYGLAKLVNVPCEKDYVLRVARSLAYERPTGYGVAFNVVVEPNEEINLAYTSQEFDLHSDLTYREISPGVQLLHCIRNSTEGGYSYFSDAFQAAATLKENFPQLFEVLLQFPITFAVKDPYRKMKFRHHLPMISLDHRGELKDIYYSPFTLPPIGHREDVKWFYLAQDVFTRLLQAKESKLITKMEPGDLYMFHNRRVLHGRSDYDATKSSRFLQGCYMDWDEITGLDEKLRSHRHE